MEDGFPLAPEAIKAWCDRNNIQFIVNEDLGQLGIPLPLGKGYLLRVLPRPDRHMMTLVVPLPVKVPPALINEVSKATALANSATFMGAWVLNHGKGEIYFRVTLPTRGVMYDDEGFKWVLDVMVMSLRSVVPALGRILREGAPASTVLQPPQAPKAPAEPKAE